MRELVVRQGVSRWEGLGSEVVFAQRVTLECTCQTEWDVFCFALLAGLQRIHCFLVYRPAWLDLLFCLRRNRSELDLNGLTREESNSEKLQKMAVEHVAAQLVDYSSYCWILVVVA